MPIITNEHNSPILENKLVEIQRYKNGHFAPKKIKSTNYMSITNYTSNTKSNIVRRLF